MFIQTINHVLSLVAGKTLDWFVPSWARPSRDAVKGLAMLNVELDPVRDWRMLRFVCDEDGLQCRAMHYLFSYIGLRGAVTPEVSHPKWNSFKRACSSAGMQYDLLRLTIAANYSHGTKITGERATSRKEYLELFLKKQPDSYFLDLYDEILMDRDMSLDLGERQLDSYQLLEEFLDCPSIKKKNAYVTSLHLIKTDSPIVSRRLAISCASCLQIQSKALC